MGPNRRLAVATGRTVPFDYICPRNREERSFSWAGLRWKLSLGVPIQNRCTRRRCLSRTYDGHASLVDKVSTVRLGRRIGLPLALSERAERVSHNEHQQYKWNKHGILLGQSIVFIGSSRDRKQDSRRSQSPCENWPRSVQTEVDRGGAIASWAASSVRLELDRNGLSRTRRNFFLTAGARISTPVRKLYVPLRSQFRAATGLRLGARMASASARRLIIGRLPLGRGLYDDRSLLSILEAYDCELPPQRLALWTREDLSRPTWNLAAAS